MFCAFHPQRIAVEKCQKCGSAICQECGSFVKGQMLCHRCSARLDPFEARSKLRDPFLAAGLSLVCPGMGQIYNGETLKGGLILASCFLILPWIYGVIDAYRVAEKINRGERVLAGRKLSGTVCTTLAVAILVSPVIVWNARQHYLETANIDVKGEMAAQRLKKVGEGMEVFFRAKGRYPRHVMEMHFSKIASFEEILCDTAIDGYQYTCTLGQEGYRIDAVPKKTPGKKYSLTTGGVIGVE